MGECPWETVARKEVSLGKGGTRMGDVRWEKVRLVVVPLGKFPWGILSGRVPLGGSLGVAPFDNGFPWGDSLRKVPLWGRSA